ncbi:ribonuclease H-like domain, reverse transcriptase, RNA-dependent DNA polymerase, partial [Tanacetum coccineum]
MTHPYPNRRFVPQAVLTRSGKINTAGASVNTAIRPVNTTGSKTTGNPQQKEYKEKGVFDSEFLEKFKLQKVWTLVDLPNGKRVIGTKWVFRNKKDERGIVVRNKARLVTQGYTQEEGINYDKVFAPVARIEAIRFRRGIIDKTLFIKKDKSDILLVQVYVDDIIFGSTKKTLCLQVQQKEDGVFISQDKYVADILKKFDYVTVKIASTPMEPNKALVKDEEADYVDVTRKTSHLHAVKRIFRYLKGNPQQEVLWIQNQMIDYGFNFMNTKIYIDNESIICIVKNPVFHSKTKHIEIRPIHLVANKNVYKEWEDIMERAATTTFSLEAEQDSGN